MVSPFRIRAPPGTAPGTAAGAPPLGMRPLLPILRLPPAGGVRCRQPARGPSYPAGMFGLFWYSDRGIMKHPAFP